MIYSKWLLFQDYFKIIALNWDLIKLDLRGKINNNADISFVYQKALILTFHTSFLTTQ